MDPIRIVIVDDHPMVRMGLRVCLASYDGITVVGDAPNGERAMQQIESWQPQVVLMDLVMPEMDGIDAIRQLKARWPEIKVIALTSFADNDRVTAAMEAGAAGYLTKDIEPVELVNAIRNACRGNVPLDSQAARVLVDSWRNASVSAKSTNQNLAALTTREMQVLQRVAEGKSNRDIAGELVISEKTVKAHVSSILSKLGVHNRTQAVDWAHHAHVFPR